VAYVDLNTVHNPATSTVAPAAWGDLVRDNQEFFIDPPACSISASIPQSCANNTNVDLLSDTELFDNDAMHSTGSNTERITIQTPGRYRLQAIVQHSSVSASGPLRAGRFEVNGTTVLQGTRVEGATGYNPICNFVRTYVFAASDYVTCQGFQNSGVAANIQLLEFSAVFITR
jgi:hypothetical protein